MLMETAKLNKVPKEHLNVAGGSNTIEILILFNWMYSLNATTVKMPILRELAKWLCSSSGKLENFNNVEKYQGDESSVTDLKVSDEN